MSFSQDTLRISSKQLKLTNLIFVEHQKYSKQIPLLKQQISNLEQINNSWLRTDSIRKLQLSHYDNTIKNQNRSIDNLNKSLKNNQNIIKYGSIVSVLTIILCLI